MKNDFQQDFYQEEIERCRRLYRGFSDIEPFIQKTFQKVFLFLENNNREGLLDKVTLEENKVGSKFKNGESIGINPTIKTETFLSFLKELGEVVFLVNPDLKISMEKFQKYLEKFQEQAEERVNREEIIGLKNFLLEEKIIAPDMATFLFTTALSATYRFNLEDIIKKIPADLWEGGNCALCGEKPHFGMLRSEDGAKILECWLCGTQWVHTRIKCPFCSNTEQEELGFFTVEENDLCRVHFCNQCGCYYKIFDKRKIAGENLVLPVHNLASLAYDLLAKEEGFFPGSGLEWVNENEKGENDS